MILHSKPTPGGLGLTTFDWHFRGSINCGPSIEKPKEEEKPEFIKEEEFKV